MINQKTNSQPKTTELSRVQLRRVVVRANWIIVIPCFDNKTIQCHTLH